MIRVGIVDDNKRNRFSLITQMGFDLKVTVVLDANDGVDYLNKMKKMSLEEQPEVVLIDIEMPNMNGIDTVAYSKTLYPNIKYLMFTVFDDDDKIFDAIRAGANGYLLKDEKCSVIIQHIQELYYNGNVPMSAGIARKALSLLANSAISPPTKKKQEEGITQHILSEREMEVLKAMSEGMDYRQIAAALFLSANTIKKHLSNIYTKLHVNSKVQAINLAREKKWM